MQQQSSGKSTAIRFGKWFLQSKLRWRHPVYLIHALTARCNARCDFCAWHPDFYDASDELTTEEIERLYRDAARAGFLGVSLWGGEPLVHRDVGRVIAHAKSLGMITNMVTNGALLKKRMGAVMPHLDRLAISVDHPSEQHDEMRGVPGLYTGIIEATEEIRRRYPRTRVVFNYTLQRANCDPRAIEEMVRITERLGIAILFNPLRVDPATEQPVDVDLTRFNAPERELIAAYAQIRRLKEGGARVINSDRYIDNMMHPPLLYRCHWPKFILPLEANGEVIDCMHWGSRPIDNVRNRPFAEILENPRVRALAGAAGESCHKCVSIHRYELSEVWEGRLGPVRSWGKNLVWGRRRPPAALPH
jgi:MoaA/NifB/PqqE/SkfB family radical SAM enzyme